MPEPGLGPNHGHLAALSQAVHPPPYPRPFPFLSTLQDGPYDHWSLGTKIAAMPQ